MTHPPLKPILNHRAHMPKPLNNLECAQIPLPGEVHQLHIQSGVCLNCGLLVLEPVEWGQSGNGGGAARGFGATDTNVPQPIPMLATGMRVSVPSEALISQLFPKLAPEWKGNNEE